jgi:hypothetical protein
MKSLTLILLAALLMANATFAADAQSIPASKESQAFEEKTVEAPTTSSAVSTGLDLSNIPQHLRYLFLYAWMLTHKTIVIK